MRAGRSICIFAEGSRFNDGRMHEFKQGAAWLAIAPSDLRAIDCERVGVFLSSGIADRDTRGVGCG
jgi:hypothetical protein